MQALRDINGGRFTVDVYNINDKLVRKGATLYYRKYRQGGGTRVLDDWHYVKVGGGFEPIVAPCYINEETKRVYIY